MLTELRQQAILDLLSQRRAVTVIELTELLNSSESTIRRDLTALHEMGRLKKVHGGATAVDDEYSVAVDVSARKDLSREEKKRIAAYGATLVSPGDFVYIDAGTTTLLMAEYLTNSKATFVTTGIECARRLVEKGLRVYVPGGLLKPGTQALVGAAARESIGRYNFTKSFIGTNGIAVRQGYTTPDMEEASIKSLAVERSYLSYVLADSSKFGKVAAVTICPLRDACILTDRMPDEIYLSQTIIKEVD